MIDLIIRNATVIDGTLAPRFKADIGVSAGKISSIGKIKDKGKTEIDASGKIAAPGFIDAHTHDDRLMLSSPDMAPKVSQGVTTVVAGNCGISLAPAPNGMKAPVAVPLDLLDDAGREGWELVGIAANNFAYLKRLSATDAVEPPPKQRARRKSTT